MVAIPGEVAFVEDSAWYIDVFQRTDNLFGFRADLFEEGEQRYLETTGRIKDGTLPADKMFLRIWIMEDSTDDERQTLPHFVIAGNILVVSQQVAYVLNQFDLGASTLHPVQLFQADRVAAFPGNWFLVQIAARKAASEPEHSKGFRRPSFSWNKSLGKLRFSEDSKKEIYLDLFVFTGSDIWIDPRLGSSLFVSQPLMAALSAENVLSLLNILRCPVLQR